ncbi:MAG: helix-turn-helix domain-containing protein [Bacteroidota bacterium]
MSGFGDRLKELRTQSNLTQEALGKLLGVGPSYVSGLEKGKETPSDTMVILISRLFHVNEKWLINGEGEQYRDIEEIMGEILQIFQPTEVYNLVIKELLKGKAIPITNGYNGLIINDPEVLPYMKYIKDLWENGDPDLRGWFKIQFKHAFPYFDGGEHQKKQYKIAEEDQ